MESRSWQINDICYGYSGLYLVLLINHTYSAYDGTWIVSGGSRYHDQITMIYDSEIFNHPGYYSRMSKISELSRMQLKNN